jgi:hypothetical protein
MRGSAAKYLNFISDQESELLSVSFHDIADELCKFANLLLRARQRLEGVANATEVSLVKIPTKSLAWDDQIPDR